MVLRQWSRKTADADATMFTFGSAEMPLARDVAFTFSVVATNSEGDSPAAMSDPVTIASLPAPSFAAGDSIDNIVIWAGHPYTSVVLPKATAIEGTDFRYKVREVPASGSNAKGSGTLRAAVHNGFELRANDVQDRTLQTASSMAKAMTKYEYVAYNTADEAVESDPLTFYITVLAPIVPTAPTMGHGTGRRFSCESESQNGEYQ